jgi:hypothetical protein
MTLLNSRRFGRISRHQGVVKRARIATAAIRALVLVLLLMQSREFLAQQSTSHQGTINAGAHKIVPKTGIWFVRIEGDKPFYFEVKNGVLSGQAGISYAVSCSGFSKSETDYSVDLSKLSGRSGHFKTLAPVRYTTPNSFVAVLSADSGSGLNNMKMVTSEGHVISSEDPIKIKITWKGTFTSSDSASGTVTVSCSLCDEPTVSSWTAAPGGK